MVEVARTDRKTSSGTPTVATYSVHYTRRGLRPSKARGSQPVLPPPQPKQVQNGMQFQNTTHTGAHESSGHDLRSGRNPGRYATRLLRRVPPGAARMVGPTPVSYTHLRAHETRHDLVC